MYTTIKLVLNLFSNAAHAANCTCGSLLEFIGIHYWRLLVFYILLREMFGHYPSGLTLHFKFALDSLLIFWICIKW